MSRGRRRRHVVLPVDDLVSQTIVGEREVIGVGEFGGAMVAPHCDLLEQGVYHRRRRRSSERQPAPNIAACASGGTSKPRRSPAGTCAGITPCRWTFAASRHRSRPFHSFRRTT